MLRHRAAAVASTLLPLASLVLVWLVFVEHLRRSDLMVFLHAAHDVSAGVNPYTAHTDPALWGGSAYVYPFLTSYLFVPLAHLPVAAADLVWFAVSGLAMIVGCRLLSLRDPVAMAAVLLCAGTVRSFQVGSLNCVLFLAAALMWHQRERAAVVAGCVTLLVGSKLFLAPFGLWLLLARPRRTWLTALAAASAFLLVGFALAPISLGEYVAETRTLAAHEGRQGMSLLRLAHDLVPGAAERWVPLALALAVTAFVLRRLGGLQHALGRSHEVSVGADRLLFCASLVIALVLTPIFWSHYIVLALLVPLLLRPTRLTALALLAVSWVLSRPHETTSVLSLPLVWRIAALFGLLLAGVVAAARAVERQDGPQAPASRDAVLVA